VIKKGRRREKKETMGVDYEGNSAPGGEGRGKKSRVAADVLCYEIIGLKATDREKTTGRLTMRDCHLRKNWGGEGGNRTLSGNFAYGGRSTAKHKNLQHRGVGGKET